MSVKCHIKKYKQLSPCFLNKYLLYNDCLECSKRRKKTE